MAAATDDIVLHAVAGAQDLPEEFVKIPDESLRRPEQQLSNSRWHGRWRGYTLFNGHYLECQRRGAPRRVVNLAYIATEPMQLREPAWRWLAAAMVMVAGATLTAALEQLMEASVLSLAALLTFTGYLLSVRQRLIFRTRIGGIALFEVPMGLFNRRRVQAFIDTMQARIDGAASILPQGEGRLAAEMAEHRRLLKEGWLSQARYDLAKKRIFGRYRRSAN